MIHPGGEKPKNLRQPISSQPFRQLLPRGVATRNQPEYTSKNKIKFPGLKVCFGLERARQVSVPPLRDVDRNSFLWFNGTLFERKHRVNERLFKSR